MSFENITAVGYGAKVEVPMKVVIEVPVEIDGKLTRTERKKLVEHLERGVRQDMHLFVSATFAPGARMLESVCRFAFGKVRLKVK